MAGVRNTVLRFFPVPKFLAMPAVGLDISDHAVRFVEFRETASGMRLGRYGSREIPSGSIARGEIKDPQKLLTLLKSIKDEFNFDFIHASLPGERAYLFTLALPRSDSDLPEDAIRNTVEFKLEENVPIPPQDTIFDYVSFQSEKGARQVGVTALPRQVVESYLTLLQSSGFAPVSFEIEAEAISRSVISRSIDRSPTLIVDFGMFKTEISVVSRGIVHFATAVDIGSMNLTAALRKVFSCSIEEAEQIKRERGFQVTKDNQQAVNAMIGMMSALKDEINRHIVYWNTHRSLGGDGQALSQVTLCGGGANLKGISDYLSGALNVSVQLSNPWINVFSFDDYIPPIRFDESLSYVTAIGLALKSFYRAEGGHSS